MKKPKFIPEFDDIPTPRVKMPELPLEKREGSFDEVELGLTQELALAEASRCLSCRRCIGCGLCLAECDPQAIVYDEKPGKRSLKVDGVLLAAGDGCFDATSKPALAYGTSPNVVTTVELSRILSPTGPFGGHAIRPGDGVPPRRVAFVQCVGSREEGIGANYCSTTCCNAALDLAESLLRSGNTTGVTIFHRGMRPFGRRGEALYRAACDDERFEFVFGEVKAVAAGDCTEPVTVTYDAGPGEEAAEFDLVVLSIGSRASSAAKSIARRVRAPFNKFGYVSADLFDPVPVGVEGVPVAGSLTEPTDAAGAVAAAHAAASLAAASLEATPAGPGPVGGGGDEPGGSAADGPALACVCEYGLRRKGLDPDPVVSALGAVDGLAGVVRADLACSPAPIADLRRATAECGASRVVVVGCHPDTHASFWRSRTGGSVAVELVAAGADAPGTAENVRLSAAGGRGRSEAPVPSDLEERLLVIGGGASGLAAADEAARRGVAVTLVTPRDALGGRLAARHSLTEGLSEGLRALVERVESEPSIDVLLGAAVAGVEEGAGGFSTTVRGPKGDAPIRHGAAVVATEDEDYDASADTDGAARVITQSDLAHELQQGPLDAKEVAVIQCVGSRTPDRPYCSRTCCAEAMANVLRLKEQSPDTRVTVLHRGIRVWGFDEEYFADAIDLGVGFTEVEEPPAVSADGVTAVEAGSGESVALRPDLVVLSTGTLPAPSNGVLADAFGLTLDGDGFFVPVDEALRPVETDRPGVFVCGTACWPASIREAVGQGRAAAGRACLYLRRSGDDAR
jgi:heterodisulfide reductase subunit A-like polyferredoxin